MENASKALLMAGGVLISLLVIGFAIFLYSSFSDKARQGKEEMAQTQQARFNYKYLAYNQRKDLTYYDILNIQKMAQEDNEELGIDIHVYLDGRDITDVDISKFDNFLEMMEDKTLTFGDTVTDLIKYRCVVTSINSTIKGVRFYTI